MASLVENVSPNPPPSEQSQAQNGTTSTSSTTITTPTQSSNQTPCSRCPPTSPPKQTYKIRSESLCASCLHAFTLARIIKRTDGFRIVGSTRTSVRRILLPLSGGVSSLSLLALLDLHVSARLTRTGRAGYECVVVWVDCSAAEDAAAGAAAGGFNDHQWEVVQQRYGQRWKFVQSRLEDVFLPAAGVGGGGGVLTASEHAELMSSLPALPSTLNQSNPAQTLSTLLSLLPTPSARSDMLSSLLQRHLVATARAQQCTIITYGDTTTRLAEKTLAETAKGRGYALPWLTSDAPESPFDGVRLMFPLQDLYRREIETWARSGAAGARYVEEILSLQQGGIDNSTSNDGQKNGITNGTTSATTAIVASKNLTIEELMRRYFAGVEESYPSVVANVVRTSGKLKAPGLKAARASTSSSTSISTALQGEDGGKNESDNMKKCGICGLAYDAESGDLLEWEGNQRMMTITKTVHGTSVDEAKDSDITTAAAAAAAAAAEDDGGMKTAVPKPGKMLCYACFRTVEKARVVGVGVGVGVAVNGNSSHSGGGK